MDETSIQILAWIAAFWTAVLGFAAWQERIASGGRFLAGLTLGAVFAHLGWAALHLRLVVEQPWVLLEPTLGYSVLFLPLGLLVAAPWRARPRSREAWLTSAFAALPLAIAVARLGCLVSGCCHGRPTAVPWAVGGYGVPARHPTVLYEMGALIALYLVIRQIPRAAVPSAVLVGFGAIRVLVQPWRAAPPLGDPLVSPAALAAMWIVTGALLSPAGLRALGRRMATFDQKRWPKLANPPSHNRDSATREGVA
jgi:prolipoprotein diacylglyceryltransferase